MEGAKCKIAIRGPCFATSELTSGMRRVPPSGCGYFAHVLSAVYPNNTLNKITIKDTEIQGENESLQLRVES